MELIGADIDWCEFEIINKKQNWNELAKQIFNICPDIVTQGTGSIENLEKELKTSKTLYMWWD